MIRPPGIRTATLVRAPREKVYDALTRVEHLDAWFTSGAETAPRPGGERSGAGSSVEYGLRS